MKITRHSLVPDVTIPGVLNADGSTLTHGRTIVDGTDDVGFMSYEVQLVKDDRLTLVAPPNHNHVYYCLDGEARVTLGDVTYMMTRNCCLALPPGARATLDIHCKTRMFIAHTRSISEDDAEPPPLFTKLQGIIGTSRDVDWQRGRSRRFLVEGDGFGISLHNTVAYAKNTSPLSYPHNDELAYYIRGALTYTWQAGDCMESFQQEDASDGDGWSVLVHKGDYHEVTTGDRECEGLCIFYPALKGTETHDFSNPGHSAYS